MLDGGDQAGRFPPKERDGFFQHRHIKVNLIWQEDNMVLLIDRCMAHVDEHVGRCKGVEREVAGAIAGIAADDHVEPLTPQGVGPLRRPSFQAGRELEGDARCPPLPQLPDKVREIV